MDSALIHLQQTKKVRSIYVLAKNPGDDLQNGLSLQPLKVRLHAKLPFMQCAHGEDSPLSASVFGQNCLYFEVGLALMRFTQRDLGGMQTHGNA